MGQRWIGEKIRSGRSKVVIVIVVVVVVGGRGRTEEEGGKVVVVGNSTNVTATSATRGGMEAASTTGRSAPLASVDAAVCKHAGRTACRPSMDVWLQAARLTDGRLQESKKAVWAVTLASGCVVICNVALVADKMGRSSER